MRLEFFGAGGSGAASVEATRLVVFDSNDNPIALAVEYEPGQTFVAHAADDEFEPLLRALGIRASTVVRRITVGG